MGGEGSGRRPAPTALKQLKGTRKDRVNKNEPVPEPAGTDCPTNLAPGAAEVWRRLAPDLAAKKVLTSWSVDAFAAFCDAVDRRDRAAEALDRDGEVITEPVLDKQGNYVGERQVRSQWWLIWKQSNEVMLRLGARFGLTPSDLGTLKVDDGGSANPRERLLS